MSPTKGMIVAATYLLTCTQLADGKVVGPFDFSNPMTALRCAEDLFEQNRKADTRALIKIISDRGDMDVTLNTTFQVQQQHFHKKRTKP